MASLRDMVDGNVLCAAAPKAIKQSPVAEHVANHMQDPMGATKDQFSKLTQKKLEYDQAREEAQRNLAPVQSTLDHISQVHGIQPGRGTPGMMPAEQPMNPDDPEQYDEQGNPLNMGQTVGKMNMNRPSLAGNQPGVSPGPQQSVVPPKMGMPKPGSQGSTFNKQAAPPKGNRSIPGAKGPGDPKVVNKAKKAQNDSKGREVELHIKGSRIEAGGPGSGRHKQDIAKLSLKHSNSNYYDRGPALNKEELARAIDHIRQGRAYYDEDEGRLDTMAKDANKQSSTAISSQVSAITSDVKQARRGYKGSMAASSFVSSSGDLGRSINAGASNRLSTQLGIEMLRFGGVTSIDAYGTSEGVSKAWDARGRGGFKQSTGKDLRSEHVRDVLYKLGYKKDLGNSGNNGLESRTAYKHPSGHNAMVYWRDDGSRNVTKVSVNGPSSHAAALGKLLGRERMNALASGLSDKATDMGEQSELSYNPKFNASSRKRKSAAKKGWSVRNHGHLSAKEKESHHSRNRQRKQIV